MTLYKHLKEGGHVGMKDRSWRRSSVRLIGGLGASCGKACASLGSGSLGVQKEARVDCNLYGSLMQFNSQRALFHYASQMQSHTISILQCKEMTKTLQQYKNVVL